MTTSRDNPSGWPPLPSPSTSSMPDGAPLPCSAGGVLGGAAATAGGLGEATPEVAAGNRPPSSAHAATVKQRVRMDIAPLDYPACELPDICNGANSTIARIGNVRPGYPSAWPGDARLAGKEK